MRKIILYVVFFTISCQIKSQNNINADCISAIPLCSTPSFTFNSTSGVGTVTDIPTGNNISNPATNPASNNSGCLLSGELKPQWLLITIGNAGFLEFVFGAGNSPNPQAGYYDWAMWPYTPTTCSQIQNNTLPPMRCNWNGTSTGGTGIASAGNIPPGGSASNFEPPLAVTPCQQFIICISNFSGVNTLVSFQSLGTASLSCNPNCLAVNNPFICAGSSASIIASSSGNLAGVSYSLNPGGLISPTPTFVVNPLVNTNYTVFATGVNNQSVTVTQTAVCLVTVYAKPSTIPTFTQSTCLSPANAFDLGLNFLPSNPVPNYTINWSPIPSGIVSPTQTSVSGTVSPGPYSATITAVGGCSTIANFTINSAPAAASISLTPAGPIYTLTCYQPTITINALNANCNYTWTSLSSPPIYTSIGNFNNTNIGTWAITAINPVSNCVSTKTIVIAQNTVAPLSSISPTLQNVTCANPAIQTLTLTSTIGVNITHNIYTSQLGFFSANTQTALYVPTVCNGTYVLVNNVNGCSTTKTFTVQASPGFPTFSIQSAPPSFTLGCSTKSILALSIYTAIGSPPGTPVTYSIIPPNTSSLLINGNLSAATVYTINSPGTWTVICRNGGNNCDSRLPVTILQNTLAPDIDTVLIPQNVLDCSTRSIVIEGYSPSPNINYNWSFAASPNPVSVSSSSLSIGVNTISAPTKTLINQYTLTITDNNNLCASATVIPIYQNLFPPQALITTGANEITCLTPTVLLTNFSSTGIPPNTFPRTYPVIGQIWRGPSPQEEVQQSSTYLASIPGAYTMVAKDLNNGCITATTIAIADNRIRPVVNSPLAPPPFVLDCGPNSATLQPIVAGDKPSFEYIWTCPVNAATNPAANTPSKSDFLTTNTIGLYRVLVRNTKNGCTSTANMSVINGTLTADFSADLSEGYAPLSINLTNKSNSTANNLNINTYWNFGNGTYSVTPSVTISPTSIYHLAGTYTITAYVNKGACKDTIYKVIRVEIPSSLEIPNVFTPNGDNVNDQFFLKTSNLDEINFKIFDRWGHIVYELISYAGNIAWDGKNQFGKEVSDGVYYYTLKAKGIDGQVFNKTGTINLFR